MRPALTAPSLEEIYRARERIARAIIRSPLLKLNVDSPAEIYLKLENLQPIGSFKLRGAGNAILEMPAEDLAPGVYTPSAGNHAQGLGWWARQLGVACTVVVPDTAPQIKLEAIERLGASIVKLPRERWHQIIVDHGLPGMTGTFVHPVSHPAILAGQGTIGLEIAEDLPDVDAVYVPYGGGALACGIAAALRVLAPRAQVYACEVETATPLSAAWAAGQPLQVPYRPTFVDGVGGAQVLPEMWPLARALLAGPVVVSIPQVTGAIRLMVERNHVISEGAGATTVAAALRDATPGRKVVCIISGGNIDSGVLATILRGEMP